MIVQSPYKVVQSSDLRPGQLALKRDHGAEGYSVTFVYSRPDGFVGILSLNGEAKGVFGLPGSADYLVLQADVKLILPVSAAEYRTGLVPGALHLILLDGKQYFAVSNAQSLVLFDVSNGTISGFPEFGSAITVLGWKIAVVGYDVPIVEGMKLKE